MKLLLVILIIVALVAAWRMRVPLLAKILGQSEGRIDRRINRKP